MGETMELYFNLYEGSITNAGTLEDSCIEILAQGRLGIAQAQIQIHFGDNTHKVGLYMQNLGEPLALPGTQNMIEHLSKSFNLDYYIREFFKAYTVDYIIETLQSKIKSSQVFREKLIDWLRDQVHEWKKEEYQKRSEDILQQVKALPEGVAEGSLSKHIDCFLRLMMHLKDNKIPLPSMESDWSNFIEELFALGQTKEWCKAQGLNILGRQALKQDCSEEYLQLELKNLDKALLDRKVAQLEKARKMQKVIPLNQETLLRILRNEADLHAVVQDYLDRERSIEFFGALDLETINEKGIPSSIMEWILVSHKILLPQEVER